MIYSLYPTHSNFIWIILDYTKFDLEYSFIFHSSPYLLEIICFSNKQLRTYIPSHSLTLRISFSIYSTQLRLLRLSVEFLRVCNSCSSRHLSRNRGIGTSVSLSTINCGSSENWSRNVGCTCPTSYTKQMDPYTDYRSVSSYNVYLFKTIN